MSSRALRKAQKRREEEEALQRLQAEAEELESSEEDDDDQHNIKPQRSVFAMLDNDEAEDDDDDNDNDESEDLDKGLYDRIKTQAPEPVITKSKKAKKKKSKAKTKPTTTENGDDIDAALKALSMSKKGTDSGSASHVDPEVAEACKLLEIDTRNLHAQNEMRRLFGRAAVDSTERDEQHNARRGNGQERVAGLAAAVARQPNARGHRTGGLSGIALRRNSFIQGKEEWPMGTGGGLGMEVVEKRADGTVEYRFVHNSAYQSVQADFELCVRSMDPEQMVHLLHLHPYHISTLLQVSEIAKHQGDHSISGDLLERALFSFGRALHSTFATNLAQGKVRLDFRRPENREFWLTASRYITNLSMRATWRTVFEWAKLLLSLDPINDPYRIRLVIDQYAIRARQPEQLISLANHPLISSFWSILPNISISLALAYIQTSQRQKGQQLLFRSAQNYPWIFARLYQTLDLPSRPPPGIWGSAPRTDWEKLHSELYALRAKDLWLPPEAKSLLQEICAALPDGLKPAEAMHRPISDDEGRHVLLTDKPELIALLPRSITARVGGAGDSLPPLDEVRSYRLPEPGRGQSRAPASTADAGAVHRILEQIANIMPGAWGEAESDEDGDALQRQMVRMLQEAGVAREEFERQYRAMREETVPEEERDRRARVESEDEED